MKELEAHRRAVAAFSFHKMRCTEEDYYEKHLICGV